MRVAFENVGRTKANCLSGCANERRGSPAPELEPEPAAYTQTTANGPARKVSEFEQEALFQEWVQRALGTNPDKMDDDAYSTSFEAFKTHMFRSAPPEPP